MLTYFDVFSTVRGRTTLWGKRYFCLKPRCPHHAPGAKSKSFVSWGQDILEKLPKDLLLSFPGSSSFFPFLLLETDPKSAAFLTRRAAIDKQLLRTIQINFSDGVGSEASAEMCLRLAALDYDDRQLIWQFALLRAPRSRWPVRDVSFPPFDRASIPTRWYLKTAFVDWSSTMRYYLDHAISVLSGLVLKWDHSFKLPKLVAKLSGAKSFEALFTIMNEFEQVRFQAFVITKSFAHLGPYFEGILTSLKATGQPAPVYGYTDNPGAETGFIDSVMPSLRSTLSPKSSSNSKLPRATTSASGFT